MMTSININDIPVELHNSKFYLNLDLEDVDQIILIPTKASNFNLEVTDIKSLNNVLNVCQFFDLDLKYLSIKSLDYIFRLKLQLKDVTGIKLQLKELVEKKLDCFIDPIFHDKIIELYNINNDYSLSKLTKHDNVELYQRSNYTEKSFINVIENNSINIFNYLNEQNLINPYINRYTQDITLNINSYEMFLLIYNPVRFLNFSHLLENLIRRKNCDTVFKILTSLNEKIKNVDIVYLAFKYMSIPILQYLIDNNINVNNFYIFDIKNTNVKEQILFYEFVNNNNILLDRSFYSSLYQLGQIEILKITKNKKFIKQILIEDFRFDINKIEKFNLIFNFGDFKSCVDNNNKKLALYIYNKINLKRTCLNLLIEKQCYIEEIKDCNTTWFLSNFIKINLFEYKDIFAMLKNNLKRDALVIHELLKIDHTEVLELVQYTIELGYEKHSDAYRLAFDTEDIGIVNLIFKNNFPLPNDFKELLNERKNKDFIYYNNMKELFQYLK